MFWIMLLLLLWPASEIKAVKLPNNCNLAGSKRHKILHTGLTLITPKIKNPQILDPTSSRVCLLDALKLLCSARRPNRNQPYADGAVFERPDMYYELEGVIANTAYPKITWDEACVTTRGLLDLMERSNPYYREVSFFVFRNKNLIATGHLLADQQNVPTFDGVVDEKLLNKTMHKADATRNRTLTILDYDNSADGCVLDQIDERDMAGLDADGIDNSSDITEIDI